MTAAVAPASQSKWSADNPGYLPGRHPGDGAKRAEELLKSDPAEPYKVRRPDGTVEMGRLVRPGEEDYQPDDAFSADTEGTWRVSLPSLPVLELPGTFGDRRKVKRDYEELMNVNGVNSTTTSHELRFTPGAAKPKAKAKGD